MGKQYQDMPPYMVEGSDERGWQGQCCFCTYWSWDYEFMEQARNQVELHLYAHHHIKIKHEERGIQWKMPTAWHPKTKRPIQWEKEWRMALPKIKRPRLPDSFLA